MNQAIANIIRNHISGLDFVDKIAGMTSVLTFDQITRDKENNPTTVQKSYPIACCVTPEECEKQGAYNDLMPNSEYKTVIYFEDKGVQYNSTSGRYKYYTSNVRLVCWINVAKILGDACKTGISCTLSAHLIAEIIRTLPEFPQHHAPFNMVYSEVISQEIRTPSIFASYTYDEKHAQYLMYPYDYFALDIQTTFAICFHGTQVYNSACNSSDLDNLAAPVALPATNIQALQFTANWQGVTNATGYKIQISTFTDFHEYSPGQTSELYDLVYAAQNTTYYYRVKAYNDYTESAWSNVITLTTLQTIFADWFLPSKDELIAMYTELHLYGVGGFFNSANGYWTSSEQSSSDAWYIYFGNGNGFSGDKTGQERFVRACRAFTSTINYNLRDISPAGGYIFWKSGNDYLESAPADSLILFYDWCTLKETIGTTSTALGQGQSNTNKIIARAYVDSAAKLCDDLIVNNP
jgi:hypothetical protein